MIKIEDSATELIKGLGVKNTMEFDIIIGNPPYTVHKTPEKFKASKTGSDTFSRYSTGDKAVKIGWDYYDSLPDHKKTEVYTPRQVVQFMVKNALTLYSKRFPTKNIETLQILDPCCGGGIFLIYMIRELHDRSEMSKKTIVQNNIYGYDLDIGAIKTTKLAIQCEVGEPIDLPHIQCADTLLM